MNRLIIQTDLRNILVLNHMLVHQEDFQKTVKDSYSDNSQEVFFYPVELCNKKKGCVENASTMHQLLPE